MKNYFEMFMRDNGLEYGEEFEVEEREHRYKIVKDGLGVTLRNVVCENNAKGIMWELLSGAYTVKKLPFVPKEGENFYSVNENKAIDKSIWRDGYIDFALYVTGNCYRTRAEAEANIDKHIQAWRDAGVVRGEWVYAISKGSCMDWHVTAKCSECGWDWFSKEGIGNPGHVFGAFITNGDSKPDETKAFLLENAKSNNSLRFCPNCGADMREVGQDGRK